MLYFLTGESSFERERFLKQVTATFSGTIEKLQGGDVDATQFGELLQAQSLFGDKRLVIIDELSSNKPVWEQLPDLLDHTSDDVTLVLIEPKPDKRTRTYKELQKRAKLHDFAIWTYKNQREVEQWVTDEAKSLGVNLTQAHIRHFVDRTGFDQWRLYHGLQKLALAGEMTTERIDEIIEAHPEENIFQLFETALRGDKASLQSMVETLRQTEDAYKTFGLLSSQVLQFAALAYGDKPSGEVAKDIGAHPFVLSKLAPLAKRAGATSARQLIKLVAETDMQMKSTGQDPWLLLEKMLIEIAEL